MAVNFDKIKQKVESLNNRGRKKSVLWRPSEGTTLLRLVPWPNFDEPFKERKFYYNIGDGPGILAPSQFKKPDPIQELIDKLKAENKKESYNEAKQYFPKTRFYAPVVVRGEESEGVKIWGFGSQVAQALYNVFLDEDYGDIADPNEGFDIKVTLTKGDGDYGKTTVMVRPKPCPLVAPEGTTKKALTEAEKKQSELLENVPDLDEIYKLMSYEEIAKRVNDHMSEGEEDADDGTEHEVLDDNSDADEISEKEFDSIGSAFEELGDMVEEAS